MSSNDPATSPADIFSALGDPTRLSLLNRLSEGEAVSISVLSAGTSLTRQAVTKHLRVLEDAGLVLSQRAGRESRYAFRPDPVIEAQRYLNAVSDQWSLALNRLKALVED